MHLYEKKFMYCGKLKHSFLGRCVLLSFNVLHIKYSIQNSILHIALHCLTFSIRSLSFGINNTDIFNYYIIIIQVVNDWCGKNEESVIHHQDPVFANEM